MLCCLAMGCAAQRGVRHGAGRQVRCHGQRQHRRVRSRSAADVTVHPCMFKRAGYAFAGWNTEEDGTGTWYWVNGVPVTDWRDGDTVELYAQWKKAAAFGVDPGGDTDAPLPS